MKKEALTFTREELLDIKHALLMEINLCKRQNLHTLYEAMCELFIKVDDYLEN